MKQLMGLLKDLPSMINLLLFNRFPGCAYERLNERKTLRCATCS
jgi:adenine C2-methylase RlmN of 23S rRNA A2503 and tRNA A37